MIPQRNGPPSRGRRSGAGIIRFNVNGSIAGNGREHHPDECPCTRIEVPRTGDVYEFSHAGILLTPADGQPTLLCNFVAQIETDPSGAVRREHRLVIRVRCGCFYPRISMTFADLEAMEWLVLFGGWAWIRPGDHYAKHVVTATLAFSACHQGLDAVEVR